ncbi:hypothetical protein SUGI_0940750 [Cryptomeria japonica]|nr:hypothetical protein SUGI_0940750 [Cryptomeria japonica]
MFDYCIIDYIANGNWKNLTFVNFALSIRQLMLSRIHIPSSRMEDQVVWNYSLNGMFSASSAFNVEFDNHMPPPFWALLWNSKLVPKIDMQIWLLAHNKALKINNLCKRVFLMPNRC